jgi:hypothetical protein
MAEPRSGHASDQPIAGEADESQASNPQAVALMATAVILVIRLWLVRTVTFCGTPDSCSYLALGESLSRHRGFVENFLYQYQMVDVRLPQHGIEYWRPGTSFLFLLAQPFGGVTLHSSLVITVLAGLLMAAAAWRIAANVFEDRRVACLAYLLCLVLPPVWGSAITPDSSIFYGAAVAWFLALFRVDFRSYGEDALAFVCLVAVNLIRNDAVLLVVPLVVVLWMRRRNGSERDADNGRGRSWTYCAGALAAFGLAMVPMMAVSRAVLGAARGSHIAESLYLTDLSELLFYGQPVTLQTALGHGIKRLLMLRISTTAMIAYRFVFLMCGFAAVLLPGIASLVPARRKRLMSEVAGPAAFWLTVVAAYGLGLPAIGQFSALRSFTGVLPATAAAMAAGVAGYCVSARAARALGWSVVAFLTIAGVMAARRGLDTTNEDGAQARAVAKYLQGHGADRVRGSLVMTSDAAQFAETTGYAAVPVPSNGMAGTLAAVRDLHPTYVVVKLDPESDYAESIVAALKPVSAEHVTGTKMLVLTLAPAGALR